CSDRLLVAATETPPRCSGGVVLHRIVTAETLAQSVPRGKVVRIYDRKPGPDATSAVDFCSPEGEQGIRQQLVAAGEPRPSRGCSLRCRLPGGHGCVAPRPALRHP